MEVLSLHDQCWSRPKDLSNELTRTVAGQKDITFGLFLRALTPWGGWAFRC